MKNKTIFLLMTAMISITLYNCTKDTTVNSNISKSGINGSKFDSINFTYNWISPTDVSFLNSKTGYIVGSNGDLIKTIDSAKTWMHSYIESDSSGVMTSAISFINDKTGYIYGTWNILNGNFYGILYKTTDGGTHWTKQYYNTAYHLLSMKFFDESHGIALDWINSGSYVVTTDNGGKSWKVLNLDLNPSMNRLLYLGDACYATGQNQTIYKSIDHGETWTSIRTPVSSLNFFSGFYFINENIGFLNNVDNIYKTTDGGNNWNKMNPPTPYFRTPFSPFEYFHFYNNNDGICIQDSFAYIGGDFPSFIGTRINTTTDGGVKWIKSDLLKQSFGLVVFVSDNLAYCISNKNIYTLQKK
jgi:photosystem II stability/assembly factor-like uncharacterized protein